MEYLIGAIVMLITLNFINGYVVKKVNKHPAPGVLISQSRSFEATRMFSITLPNQLKFLDTQSTKHFESKHLRVVILDEVAYWIFENSLYTADLLDGDIDKNSTKKVDTMTLDKVELDKLVLVVEQLTGRRSNDRGYPGDS